MLQVEYYQRIFEEHRQTNETKLQAMIGSMEDPAPPPTDDYDKMIADKQP
jgi:hypothetical protein